MSEFVRHKKRQTTYEVLKRGFRLPVKGVPNDGDGLILPAGMLDPNMAVTLRVQVSKPEEVTDETTWVVYVGLDVQGYYWTRPEPEFDDGRFEPVTPLEPPVRNLDDEPVLEFHDPAAALREIADQIEAGKYGKVAIGAVVLRQDADTVIPFGIGPASDALAVIELCRDGAATIEAIASEVADEDHN